MEKVRQQIEANVLIIIVSWFGIYMAYSLQLGRFAVFFKECLNADVVFSMLTSLITTLAWRLVERIRKGVVYELIWMICFGLFWALYGLSVIYDGSSLVCFLIKVSMVVFCIIYFIDNIIIVKEMKKRQKKEKEETRVNYSYSKRL